jgi:hypothetical protein
MAHGDLGLALTSKMKDEDRPHVLLKMLENLHPDFYPRPFRQIHNSAGEVVSIEDITTGFLTREELPKLYGICGNQLHKGDFYKLGRFPTTEVSNREIAHWHGKILQLLGNHKIKLYNSTREIWVGMHEKTSQKVFWGFMEQLTPEQVEELRKKGVIPCVGPGRNVLRRRSGPPKRTHRTTRKQAKRKRGR